MGNLRVAMKVNHPLCFRLSLPVVALAIVMGSASAAYLESDAPLQTPSSPTTAGTNPAPAPAADAVSVLKAANAVAETAKSAAEAIASQCSGLDPHLARLRATSDMGIGLRDGNARILGALAEWSKAAPEPRAQIDGIALLMTKIGADDSGDATQEGASLRAKLKAAHEEVSKLKNADGTDPAGKAEALKHLEAAKLAVTKAHAAGTAKRSEARTVIVDTFTRMIDLANAYDGCVSAFADLSESPIKVGDDARPILETCATRYPQLPDLLAFHKAKKGGLGLWRGIQQPLLDAAVAAGSALPAGKANPAEKFDAVTGRLETLLEKSGAVAKNLDAYGLALANGTEPMMRDFFDKRAANATRLKVMLAEQEALASGIEKMRRQFADIKTAEALAGKAPFLLAHESLFRTGDVVNISAARLTDALAGDVNEFVTDQISLFYFTDTRRLMKALNGGMREVTSAGNDAAEYERVRRELQQKDAEMRDAYDRLTQLTTKLVNLKVELEAAQSDLKRKQARRDIIDGDRKRKEKALTAATAAEEQGKTDLAAGKIDQAKMDSLTEARKKAEKAHADAVADNDAAAADERAARERVDEDLTQQKSLPSEIRAAQEAAAAALQILKMKRNELRSLSTAEVDAFAAQRDNAPFLYAPADSSSNDPARRVMLYAYNDSKTLFIRGLPEDVEIVKDMVAEFDRPAPQARITLWTLQMNAVANRGNRARLNTAKDRVEQAITESREWMTAATSILRDCIRKEVHVVEQDNVAQYASIRNFGVPNGLNDEYRMARNHFYEEEVALRLGFDQKKAPRFPLYYYFTRYTLPDPAGITTLGEGLMVLSLAKYDHRRKVAHRFIQEMGEYLRANDYDRIVGRDRRPIKDGPRDWHPLRFQRLLRALGLDETGFRRNAESNLTRPTSSLTTGINAHQLEIVAALKRSAIEKVIKSSPQISDILVTSVDLLRSDAFKSLQPSPEQVVFDLMAQPENIFAGPQGVKLREAIGQYAAAGFADAGTASLAQAEILEAGIYLLPLLNWLKAEYAYPLYGLLANPMPPMNASVRERQEHAKVIKDRVRSAFPAVKSNERIAAADQMLKEMIIAVEDDLDENFIQPMLRRVQREIQGPGIDVGITERTSLLTTNRSIGRVEPKASAQVDLAGETNLIEAAKQLSEIVVATQTSNLPGILSAFEKTNNEPKSELYALFSGQQFKVTPIFDPSGQALRFQFDYVQNTDIRDADGTVNPQLPRVDRHAVNNIVQLSNLEIREITRFESNSKLGVPAKQWGGIPILNTIPVLREIPIIGWFGKRDGRAGTTQASIIFAQTAMYPTIGDIGNLLTGSFALPTVAPHLRWDYRTKPFTPRNGSWRDGKGSDD